MLKMSTGFRSQRTYEELKRGVVAVEGKAVTSSQRTYEELKLPVCVLSTNENVKGSQRTYEELKLATAD